MILCDRPCSNKSEYGYCNTTYCINPAVPNISVGYMPTKQIDTTPSHYCAICKMMEFENAILCTSVFWLCDKCLNKLKILLEEVKDV